MSINKVKQLLHNLIIDYGKPIGSLESGLRELRGERGRLEVIHVYIENLSPKAYPPKKKYFDITRVNAHSKLDSWIYKNSVNNEEYGKYLDCYQARRSMQDDDVDEYIMNKHYRSQAIELLSKTLQKFNLEEWMRPRFRYEYCRKTNLQLKDGTSFNFDFRNALESFFILHEGEDKRILAIGGSGSSGQRERYTYFTTLFYMLEKEQGIPNHLLRYDAFNRYRYIGTYDKSIITFDFGSNYSIEEKLRKEVVGYGVSLKTLV